ncbi:IE-2 [Rachiplusia ou multiple nucleopolyhedrovirus]|uniref:E3 ubiquitin-protein ligase IE2 n=1 Tax=Rachiplusia ou multiple nucleopolyhedrovirus (strain R1) TaxID=654904 RepID=VIE2_NPVR1|nr:IE-2 [Rachiplusia ou multiple nucleopolyhedrovirus]Q8B9B2.1 RecName: Full=E3 ubiquitin-protein ligase IE2; AltName: Full=Immediate-early protein IE2; AltName: Full=RING-type E3 ubiquitin transferase IE2 [Rachiplusia ou MNPV (strain R1)]AAN28041.1 IE-N [Rachiplusia ou multiple nucleopolyhedrovirus]
MSRQINAATPSSSRHHRLSLSRRRINFTTPSEAQPSSSSRSQTSSSSRSHRRQERRQEQRVSEENVQIIGNVNEPLTRSYHRQGVTYNVHGEVNISNADPLLSQEDDVILINSENVDRERFPDISSQQYQNNIASETAAQRALQRALDLEAQLMNEIAPRSPVYSPSYAPNSPNYVIPQSPDLFASPQSSEQQQQSEPEEDVEVSCNICFTTFKDTKNVNSSFVTTTHCNHAVCFKCYVKIIMANSVYKCFCSATSSNCRVYNKHGYVEFMPIDVTRNQDSIKQHWRELLENNTVNNQTTDLNYVEQLQKELAELRAKTCQVEHKMTMLNSDYIMLKHKHAVAELDLQKANYDLQESTKKSEELQSTVNNLQEQLNKQVVESQAKFLEFERNNSDLVSKLQTVMSRR